jgi:hypothetical protein
VPKLISAHFPDTHVTLEPKHCSGRLHGPGILDLHIPESHIPETHSNPTEHAVPTDLAVGLLDGLKNSTKTAIKTDRKIIINIVIKRISKAFEFILYIFKNIYETF